MSQESSTSGRLLILGVILFVLLISALSVVLPLFNGGKLSAVSLIRFALGAALCWQLYQGKIWARAVSIVLMTLTGITSLLGGLALLTLGSLGMAIVALGIAYLGAALILGLARPVRSYFAAV